MDAISTTVPSITIPKPHPKSHFLHHHKPPPPPHHHHHPHFSTSVAGKPPSISSSKPKLHPTSHPLPSHVQTHRTTTTTTTRTTGYAAALVDAALCSDSLHAIHKDVKRLLKWMKGNEMLKGVMGDAFVEEVVKGKVMKEVAEKGKFRRQVVAMVKMLVAKGKSGMVAEVMEEFERIYFDLNCKSVRMVV